MCKLSIALPLLLSGLKEKVECSSEPPSAESKAEPWQKDATHKNRTLVLSAATQNTSWTKAVTENHAFWARWVAHADYRYMEVPDFGFRELSGEEHIVDDALQQRYPAIPESEMLSSPAFRKAMGAVKRLQPHWLKIHLLQQLMEQNASGTATDYSHFLWIDDDILFTSRVNLVEALYAKMDSDTHLIIARDVGHTAVGGIVDSMQDDIISDSPHRQRDAKVWRQVNTGFMFFRNSPESQALLKMIWEQRLSHLGFCTDQSCLHEQEALNNILWDPGVKLWDDDRARHHLQSPASRPVRSIVKILEPYDPAEPQLNANTVWRLTHTWKGQLEAKNYNGDPLHRRWHWGDNMAHVSGMTRSCRKEMLLWLAQYVKQWVFNFNVTLQEQLYPEGSGALALREHALSPPALWWHPTATARCVREAYPSGGGNWVLPRRGVADWDAAFVALTQGTLEQNADVFHQGDFYFLEHRHGNDNRELPDGDAFVNRAATTYLWQLLPKEGLGGSRGLPYVFAGLLQQLTDENLSGIERYWYLVMYAVKLNGKHFADVDPETLNGISGLAGKDVWCSTPLLSYEDSLMPLPFSSMSTEHSSIALPSDKSMLLHLEHEPLLPCAPYTQLALAAVAQNPEAFGWVSLDSLSFFEYHSIASEAVLRQPEQLANVDPMHYLDLAGSEKGGQAYYDLAMKAVCHEGSTLQHVRKISADGMWHDDRDPCFRSEDSEAPPLLLFAPMDPSASAGSSLPLSVAVKRRNSYSQENSCGQPRPERSLIWPWEIFYVMRATGSSSARRSKRVHGSSDYFKLAFAAVSNDGFALQFVSIADLNPFEDEYFALAEAAVAQNGKAFAFIRASALGGAMSDDYYELALKAVHARGEAFWEVDTAFLSDTELMVLVLKAIRSGDPAAFKAFNAREAISKVKYTELALLVLSGVGVEAFVSMDSAPAAGSSGSSLASESTFISSPTVGVLEFLDAGRIMGSRARYTMAEAALRQDSSGEVWEQVQELFQEGIRREDYENLRVKYGDPTI